MSESLRKVSAWLGYSDLNQGGFSHFLGLGGLPNIAAGVAPPRGMFPIGSGKGSCLFGLGDCLGVGMGEKLWMVVLLWRESSEAEQGEGMEVLVQIEGDTRQPVPP